MVLKGNSTTEESVKPTPVSKKRKRKNKAKKDSSTNAKSILVILGIVTTTLFVIFLCLYIPRATMSPEDTVTKFAEEFNDGRYKKMLRYIEPSEAKTIKKVIDNLPEGSADVAFKTVLPFVSDITNTKLYPNIISVSEEKRRAVVTVQFKTIDENHNYDVYLSKKNGIWYIKYIWLASDE